MLYLYNSLTRKKELFIPLVPGKIGLYTCGITVYDRCHLGHARSMVCFDVMVRFLRYQGYEVTFVRNITDIDDKIIKRAQEQQIPIEQLTECYIIAMHEDLAALNILPPTVEPQATYSIDKIINLIEQLIAKDYAYLTDSHDVCFEVNKFNSYGKLSAQNPAQLLAGTRVNIDKQKRSPLDFVLWKQAKPDEPSWDSPWGPGRPGWHIECSAMAMAELGNQFDIHGGGLDLQFPHHDNEIAQSEAATGIPFANYWLHVGLLQVNNEKMAKSLGNFLTIQEVLTQHHSEVIRYFLLSSHYRSALNYSKDNLISAKRALTRLYQSIKPYPNLSLSPATSWVENFNNAMNDDFNTPTALALLFELSHELNKTQDEQLAATIKMLAGTLGLLQDDPNVFLQADATIDKQMIEQLIAARLQARAAKNWPAADAIRQQIDDLGIDLEDSAQGTVWRVRV